MEEIINGLKQIKARVDSGTITTVNGTETLLSKQLEYMLEKAINYTRCCTTLPTEEEMTLEKRKTFKRIDEGIMNLDKISYGVGFRKCFSWLSKDKDY